MNIVRNYKLYWNDSGCRTYVGSTHNKRTALRWAKKISSEDYNRRVDIEQETTIIHTIQSLGVVNEH